MTLTIYTAASLRHIHAVRLLHEALRAAVPGIQILDWTDKATPPAGLTPAERRQWFDTEQTGGQVYSFCQDACANADLVIYFGASGQDAGVEVGMAKAHGVPVLGLRGPLEAPGLMLHGAVDKWVTQVEELLLAIHILSNCERQKSCSDCKLQPICQSARECGW